MFADVTDNFFLLVARAKEVLEGIYWKVKTFC